MAIVYIIFKYFSDIENILIVQELDLTELIKSVSKKYFNELLNLLA